MTRKLCVCVAFLVVACAEQTSERDSALSCDTDGFDNACVKAGDPLAIDAVSLGGARPPSVEADARGYGVRLVGIGGAYEGKLTFAVPRTGTYQIYLGTPNIPFRVLRYGETLAAGCTSGIAASACSSLRKVMTFAFGEAETIELRFGPTDLRYVRLYIESQPDVPQTCEADELVEQVAACEATADVQPIAATSLSRHDGPALAEGEVYGVRLPPLANGFGGVVRFDAPADGDYELYLGTPNIPLRIAGALQTCTRTISAAECALLRRGTRLTLAGGTTYWLELGPSANSYVRVTMRQLASPPPVYLGSPTVSAAPNATMYLAAGDLDGDGAIDLVASAADDAGGQTLVVPLENAGAGAFTARAAVATSAPAEAIVADFSGDGVADIAALAWDGQGALPASYLTGLGGFAYTRTTWGNGRDFARWLSAGDFDEDGTPDLVAAWQDLQSETGSGGFVIAGAPSFGELDSELAYGRDTAAAVAGDFDGDGHQDVFAAHRGEGTAQLFRGDGTGAVAFASEVPLAAGTRQLAAFDLDGDGTTDLVALHAGAVSIVYGGTATPETLTGTFTVGVAAGDFDHDGVRDLAIGGAGTIEIYLATPSGFVHARSLPAPNKQQTLVAADLDGDGFDDLAAPTFSSVTVWRSAP